MIYAPDVTTPSRTRRTTLTLLGTVGALVLSACGGGGSSSGAAQLPGTSTHRAAPFQPDHRDYTQVRALLGRRARAVVHRDEAAFMATVDHRDDALVAQQRTLFENMSQLSLAGLRYVMDPSVQLVPARVAGGDPAMRPQVYEFLQIAGTMEHPVSNALEETFVKRDGHWLVGAETTASDNDSFDSPQERPWFGVPIVAKRLGEMTVLVDRHRAPTLGPLATAVHDDILFDAGKLGIAPEFQLLVDATANGNTTSFNSFSQEQAAAVTFQLKEGDPHDPETFKAAAGHAIKINPRQSGTYADNPGLLRHELTHYLLHEYTGTNPTWLVEGIATWMQYYPDDFSQLRVSAGLYHRAMSADRRLPIVGLFNDDPDIYYPISQAAVAWLVTHYGMPKLLDLMKAYSAHYAGADLDALTPRVLREVYGIGEKQVVQGAFGLVADLAH